MTMTVSVTLTSDGVRIFVRLLNSDTCIDIPQSHSWNIQNM